MLFFNSDRTAVIGPKNRYIVKTGAEAVHSMKSKIFRLIVHGSSDFASNNRQKGRNRVLGNILYSAPFP